MRQSGVYYGGGGKLRSIEIAVEEVGEPVEQGSDDGRGC